LHDRGSARKWEFGGDGSNGVGGGALERGVPVMPQFSFDLALFNREKLQIFELKCTKVRIAKL
jgi:hypothetical protein